MSVNKILTEHVTVSIEEDNDEELGDNVSVHVNVDNTKCHVYVDGNEVYNSHE